MATYAMSGLRRETADLRQGQKIDRRAGEGGIRTHPRAGGREASAAPNAEGVEWKI